jgi:hypothetical protein
VKGFELDKGEALASPNVAIILRESLICNILRGAIIISQYPPPKFNIVLILNTSHDFVARNDCNNFIVCVAYIIIDSMIRLPLYVAMFDTY